MMRPTGSPSADSSGQVWITSSSTVSTRPIVCQRSPSGWGSGFDAWSGSSNTSTAVSNDTPCFARFAAALSESHVQRIAVPDCSYRYDTTTPGVKPSREGPRSLDGARHALRPLHGLDGSIVVLGRRIGIGPEPDEERAGDDQGHRVDDEDRLVGVIAVER